MSAFGRERWGGWEGKCKFIGRFEEVERLATPRGLDLRNLTAAEIDALWSEAKKRPRPTPS